MSHRFRTVAGVAATVAASLALAASAHGAAPLAHAARSCGYSQHLGFSYVVLHVTRTSCATGRRVVRAYHHRRGDRNRRRYSAHVRGYSCHERRLDSSPYQFDSRVRCRRGARRVNFTFTQNT